MNLNQAVIASTGSVQSSDLICVVYECISCFGIPGSRQFALMSPMSALDITCSFDNLQVSFI